MTDASGGDELQDSLDHSEAGAQYGHQGKLLAADASPLHMFERRVDSHGLELKVFGCLVGHQHRNLVHEFLEYLSGGIAVPKHGELVLYERVPHERELTKTRKPGGGCHAVDSSIFAGMKEYQAVILRLTRHTREDEDALTDLLNERSRGGWEPAIMTQDEVRLTVVFSRTADR
jgi:hypothetical protein